jgi:hypothetical protein
MALRNSQRTDNQTSQDNQNEQGDAPELAHSKEAPDAPIQLALITRSYG